MIEHLSYSSIQQYLTCARNWRFKYVQKIEPEEKSKALVFGSAWHEMMGPIAGGRGATAAWLESAGKHGVDADGLALGLKMVQEPKIEKVLMELKPWKLEQYFEFRVPGVPVPIIGYIDMITHNTIPIDFKTSSRKWNQERADYDLQPSFYLAGMQAMGLIESSDFPYPFSYYIFTKTKKPEVQIIQTQRTAVQILELFKMIQEVWHGIESGVFVPNPSAWQCSPNYCDFWNRCQGGMLGGE